MVGKPAEFMLANIAETFGLRRDQICMVGDRLDTDILFGQHGGLTTMLVLSGESKLPACSTTLLTPFRSDLTLVGCMAGNAGVCTCLIW